MTPKEKEKQLEQHRDILLATYDYLFSKFAGCLVLDNEDHIGDYYKRQKQQIEEYFSQHRLDRLQGQLARLTKDMVNSVDLDFGPYIKERTGFNIDIFNNLSRRVAAIVARNEIRNDNESNDVGTMLAYYSKTRADGSEVEALKSLLIKYSDPIKDVTGYIKDGYTEVVSRVKKDGMEEVELRLFFGPKPDHYQEQRAVSPDGKRQLRVAQWSEGTQAATYVALHFPTSSGAVYNVRGIHPDIKAWWKDNATIVVETKREYHPDTQHRLARSFDDEIFIEYIEH